MCGGEGRKGIFIYLFALTDTLYVTHQCRTHLNSLLLFVCVCVGGGGVSFRMVLCVGCFVGTVLYVCIEYHI